MIDSITLLAITPSLFEAAGRIGPSDLRTLDAIHLATALALGTDQCQLTRERSPLSDPQIRFRLIDYDGYAGF